jgi:hypothetical protein
MNTFYYLDGLEIKEMKTVKDFEFIKAKVNKKAVEKIEEISVPYGHELKNKKLVETKDYKAEKQARQEEQELNEKIQAKLREIAIAALQADGEI